MTRPPARPALLAVLLSVGLSAALARPAAAWNDAGHMLTALLAWEHMDERSRAWAVAVLERHPRFEPDFARRMPTDLDAADRARWVFAQAATWPDIARRFEGADAERYHRATWHYGTNVLHLDDDPEASDGRRRAATEGRDVREARDAREPRDAGGGERRGPSVTRAATRPANVYVVEALEAAVRQLHAAELPAADKAVSLCWVLHLAGDIHQPCHAGSLVSERFPAPDGDRGANNVLVEGDGRAGNLHAVWDGMVGENRALSVLSMKADRLLADPTLSRRALPELRGHASAAEWMAESAALAREAVYDPSVRAALRLQEVDPQAPFVPLRLPRNYTNDAELIARRRVALAGHRIADAVGAASAAAPATR